MSDKPAFYDAGLVSRDAAAMLLSRGRHPHVNPSWFVPLLDHSARQKKPNPSRPPPMILDIDSWLSGIGLAQYTELFRANDIDGELLGRLTSDDLKEIGVASLGHRKQLMEAIAALGAVAEAPPAPAAAIAARAAERRQLTVMFVDLVGSTALSGRLDPEEMRDVLRAYQNTVAGEISRLEGFTAKLMGDGVLAYFGWPRTHEDEAERAVRAGLAVVAAVGRLPKAAGEPLAARVGIATGLVVVGDLIGEGAAQEQAVVGDTPNLAARLQGAAEPGMVVIAEATRRLLGDRSCCTTSGRRPSRASRADDRLRGARRTRARKPFRGEAGGGVAPIVGRDQELALLLERWRQAKSGEGQVVLLTGEAGIGKSRITEALVEQVDGEPHVLLALPMFALPRGLRALPSDPADHVCRRLCRGRQRGSPAGPAGGAAARRQRRHRARRRPSSRRSWVSTERRATAR